jgi:hypothetical protein
MKYYKARITCGSLKKKKQIEKTIWVRTSDKESIGGLLTVIRKIPFGRLLYAKAIERDEYIAGVSGKSGR